MAEKNEDLEGKELEGEGLEVDEGTLEDGESGDEGSGEETAAKGGKTFTQAEVSRMMAVEKRQGKNAAFKFLGIDPKNKEAVSLIKNVLTAQKQASEKEDTTSSKEDKRLVFLDTKMLIIEAGVKLEHADDITTLLLSKVSDDDSVEDLIVKYKEKYAGWFQDVEDKDDEGDDDESEGKAKVKGTGASISGMGKKKSKDSEVEGLGKRLAAQRTKSTKKSNYWK